MFKGLAFIFSLAMVLFFTSNAVYAAVNILYEHREHEQLARGVEYIRSRMMTERGMLDVHVVLVDLSEPYITVAPVTSSRQLGRKETALRLISDAGAIAGINADFFDSGNFSDHFGPMARDGQLVSANTRFNTDGSSATFFVDIFNNMFIDFITVDIQLFVNGRRSSVPVGAYNTIGSAERFRQAVVIDRHTMTDTSDMVARFPDVVQIPVENGFVTHVFTRGEVLEVPEDGFVILLPGNLRHLRNEFIFDDRVEMRITTSLDLEFYQIAASIGGYGVIVQNGVPVSNVGLFVTGRHPRSAVGITRCGRLAMVAVDGRTHSVGATHTELASILLHYNIVDAMHFDGGGSTTMAVRDPRGNYSVANTPSEGTLRPVINALGVFDRSPVVEMERLAMEPLESHAVVGVPLDVDVFGMDRYWNRIPLDGEPTFYAHPISGTWENGRYIPRVTGMHEIFAMYDEYVASTIIYVHALAELQFDTARVNLLEGGRARLQFSGIAADGSHLRIPDGVELHVLPGHLGYFDGDEFVATRGGAGFIAAQIGGVHAYIPVTVGGAPWPVDMFTSDTGFLNTPPEYVTGATSVRTVEGQSLLYLDYTFRPTDRTQAAYVTFDPPLAIPGIPIALRLWVHGDGSGHWLRGRVQDGAGNFHNIDFTRHLDFTGWQTVVAALPADAPAPFTLDRIYPVVLDAAEETSHTIVFYGLEVLYAFTEITHVPRGNTFFDPLRANPGFTGVPDGASHVFHVPAPGEASYSMAGVSEFAVLTMTARGGGIFAGDMNQWRSFVPDIRRLDKQYVVILLDENPLRFARPMEYELLHLALTDLRSEGFVVFVVSATGDETVLTMRDGIRYIDLARPEEPGAGAIWFFSDGSRIWWRD